MSIIKKDYLQKLIKSLTKNEKKIFTESLNTKSDQKLYLQLFNLINKESNPTQAQLKKLFDNKANQLAVIKKYLSKLILRSLKSTHQDNTIEQKITNSFLEIDILSTKDLSDLTESEIDKTIKLCRNSENYTLLLHALDLQKKLLIKKFGQSSESTKKTFNEILEEQNQVIKKIQNLNEYQKLQANFYDQFHQSSGLNLTVYTSLHTNPLLTSDKNPLSLSARLIQAEILYSMHIFRNQNYQEAFASINNVLKQLELNSQFVTQYPEKYLSLLNQQLQLLLHLKKFTEIPPLLQKIRQSATTFKFDFKQENLLHTTLETIQLELQLYTETKDFHSAHQLLPQIQKTYQYLLSPSLKQWKTLLDYEIARLYYFEKNYPATLQQISLIEQSPHSLRESETLLQALYLSAIIYIQQRNFLALKKLLPKIQSIYTQSRPPQVSEKQFLKLLTNYPQLLIKSTQHQQITKQIDTIISSLEKRQNSMLSEIVNWLQNTFLLQSQK